jgi:hypothetical protein
MLKRSPKPRFLDIVRASVCAACHRFAFHRLDALEPELLDMSAIEPITRWLLLSGPDPVHACERHDHARSEVHKRYLLGFRGGWTGHVTSDRRRMSFQLPRGAKRKLGGSEDLYSRRSSKLCSDGVPEVFESLNAGCLAGIRVQRPDGSPSTGTHQNRRRRKLTTFSLEKCARTWQKEV